MLYKDRGVTLDRLELLWNGRGYPDKFGISLSSKIYSDRLPAKRIRVLRNTGIISFKEAKDRLGEYKDCKIGDQFGKTFDTQWFFVELSVPKEKIEQNQEVHFLWDSTTEAMIYNTEGKPLQGLTAGSSPHEFRTSYIIYRQGHKQELDPKGNASFFIEWTGNGLFGNFYNGNMLAGVDMNRNFPLNVCEIATFHRDAWELMQEFKVVMDSAKHLDTKQDSRADEALMIANEIVNICKPGDSSTYQACRSLTKKFLQVPNSAAQHTVFAVGHCHIDMAWLWPFFETRRKGGRSWSSQTELFKNYDKFNFCASSASLYEWVLQDYPLLFAEIKDYVKAGRFLPVGGAWLEFDGYVPSGESMARQLLYGQRFFKKHFGSYCDVFFLPDTFGYSAQLPQLIKLGGMRYFLTQKLSWNRYNKFPHSSFNWKGIDGTSVLTHFPPADTYCGSGDVDEVLKSQTNFKDKGRSNCSLYLFGIGDGGGGPLPHMIDKLHAMENVAGIPRVECGSTVSKFFKEMEHSSHNLMTWDGELYLELHNGTYTTMANNKKCNRMCELMMRDAELFATLRAILIDKNSQHYDKKMYDEVWKNMMLFQFHDVLPGSCIRMVYDVTEKEYPIMINKLQKDIDISLNDLSNMLLKGTLLQKEEENTVVFYNSLQFDRNDVVEWNQGAEKKYSPIFVKGIASAAYPTNVLASTAIKEWKYQILEAEDISIETPLLSVKISLAGQIKSIIDKETMEYSDPKTCKEAIRKHEVFRGGNTILIHDDVPLYWDAWDLWIYYQETHKELTAYAFAVDKSKPHKVSITFKYKISELSVMEQTIVVNAATKRIDFETSVDWHETHKILRTYFPLAIRSDFVTCDIQSGNIRRPTVVNTSWDAAKYEVCSHKFVDMSEANYGVALLNNCKYGYSARDAVLSLSLLKSSKSPNEVADMGSHKFIYSLYVHKGSFCNSDVAEEAYKLNVPLYEKWYSSSIKEKKELQYVKIDKSNVILDALKLDEEEKKHVIMRVHENIGAESRNKVEFSFDLKETTKVNILEEVTDDWEIVGEEGYKNVLKTDSKQIFQQLKPYQILTLKIEPNYK